jgi:hypothetical protein
MGMMGDTAIEWAQSAAEVAYSTNAFSPRSERMRTRVVRAMFDIVREEYNTRLSWEDFWEVVEARIRELQAKDIKERSVPINKRNSLRLDRCDRSIEDLFNVDRPDPVRTT